MTGEEKLLQVVNRSGFPLQMGLAHLVASTRGAQHGWKVIDVERAWQHPSEPASGFTDLVLEDRHGTLELLLECKRVTDACWIFLRASTSAEQSFGAKAFARTERWFNWCDVSADPLSVQSQFCVVPGHDTQTRPLLERAAAELILATEATAHRDRKEARTAPYVPRRFYFTAIVTTAQLKICAFDPGRMDLSRGTLGDDARFEDVDFVRFRKELASRVFGTYLDDPNENAALNGREQVVFVINTAALLRFLGWFSVQAHSWQRVANISGGVTEYG